MVQLEILNHKALPSYTDTYFSFKVKYSKEFFGYNML